MTRAWRRAWTAVAAEGRDRLALRGLVLVLSLLAGALTYLAAPAPETGVNPVRLPVVLLVLLAFAASAAPDSAIMPALLGGHIAVWGMFVPRPERAVDLIAPAAVALLLLGIHQAGAAVGVWPPGAVVPATARARWLRWTATVAAAALLAAAAAAVLLHSSPPGSAWVSVLGLVGLGAGAVAAYVKSV